MRRSLTSAASRWICRCLALSALAWQPSAWAAITFDQAPQSDLDMSQLGRVALVGDFDSISLYEFVGQGQDTGSANGSHALFTRFPNGLFHALSSPDGNIQSVCAYKNKGTYQGLVVGGNFTSLGGIKTGGIALYNPDEDLVMAIPGISGRVDALFCDNSASKVYVGGTFTANESSNAIVWAGGWEHTPFKGFNGPVKTITKTNNSVLFGGSFSSLGTRKSRNSTTETEDRLRLIPNSSANLYTITDRSSWTINSDPSNLLCSSGSEDVDGKVWFGPDYGPASLQAEYGYEFTPYKLRLWNTDLHNHGTKTWRFTAFPINGIMNFTYTDTTGKKQTCDAWCPLPQGNSTYQDFYFVNEVGMNTWRLDLNEWYGTGPGLAGIQIYADDMNEYAINDFNSPSCGTTSNSTTLSQTTGPWTRSPYGISSSQYLMATVTGNPVSADSLSVTIYPEISQSGNYSIALYTPGCINDGTCSTRGKVTVTAKLRNGDNAEEVSAEIWQTNNYDKYDPIFFSFVDMPEGDYKPVVTIRPSPGQSGTVTFVVQSLKFDLVSVTGGLNGLYEYDTFPRKADADLANSIYNAAGRKLDSGAVVNAVLVGTSGVYAAGNFTGPAVENVLGVGSSGLFGLSNGGLDDEVLAMYQDDEYVYFGGSFEATHDRSVQLKHIARYHVNDKKWSALGGGVDGAVQYIATLSVNISATEVVDGIAFSGTFSNILAFDNDSAIPADSIAIWIPTKSDWLYNVYPDAILLSGRLTAAVEIPDSDPIYAGDISSQALAATGAVGLRPGQKLRLDKLPFSIGDASLSAANGTASAKSKVRRAAVNGTADVQGIVTGLMYNENALNITIVGGQFASVDSDGKAIYNLLMTNGTDGDRIRGLPDGLATDSTVRALGTYNTNLFVGGSISGQINGNDARGIVIYDLRTLGFASTQPPALAGTDVVVNAITASPNGPLVYVGGDFDGAGSFRCPGLCVYNADRAQWQSPSGNLDGTVSVLSWIDQTRLLVGGNFTVQGESTNIQIYDTNLRTFLPVNGGNAPGDIVTAITPANQDSSEIFVSGTSSDVAFLAKNDGQQWHVVDGYVANQTVIRGLQVFTTTKDHAHSDLVPESRALLVLGSIRLQNFGLVSAAVYDGLTFVPFALTSGKSRTGSLSRAFVQYPANFFRSSDKELAVGFVVLIGMAIALVLTCLLVVAGLLLQMYQGKKEGYVQVPPGKLQFRQSAIERIPPQDLFRGVNIRSPVPAHSV